MRMNIRNIPLVSVAVLLLMVGLTSATTTSPITTANIQTLNGFILRISGAFNVTNVAFDPVPGSSSATAPCNFGSVLCTTALNAGDWSVLVILQLNNAPVVTTSYTISLCTIACAQFLTPSGQFVGGPSISFSVSPSVSPGPTTRSVFQFDTGSSNLGSSAVYTIIVV